LAGCSIYRLQRENRLLNAEAFGRVQIKLHSGTKVTGALVDRALAFQIDPGPTMTIFAGYLRSLVAKKLPEAGPAKAP